MTARRAMTFGGRDYAPGDVVDPTALSERKAAQLIEHGFLAGEALSLGPLEATRAMTLDGRAYATSDTVDVAALPDHKVAQLLNLRFLQPKPA